MTKKEALKPPSLDYMFGEILQKQGLFHDSDDWERCKFSCHAKWLKPLLDMGAIVEVGSHPAWPDVVPKGESQFNYHDYKVTPAGLRWWLDVFAGTASERSRKWTYEKLVQPWGGLPSIFDGKGIGAELVFQFFFGQGPIAARGVLDGYFEFVSYYYYPRDLTGATMTVRLTEKGLRFFDSLPRLVLECA